MTADFLDAASELETKDRERIISHARKGLRLLPSTGHCYYCNDKTEGNSRFCDQDCRDYWELEQEAYKRNGKDYY